MYDGIIILQNVFFGKVVNFLISEAHIFKNNIPKSSICLVINIKYSFCSFIYSKSS